MLKKIINFTFKTYKIANVRLSNNNNQFNRICFSFTSSSNPSQVALMEEV